MYIVASYSFRTELIFFCHLYSPLTTSIGLFDLLDGSNTIEHYMRLVTIPTLN